MFQVADGMYYWNQARSADSGVNAWYVGDAGQSDSLRMWQQRMGVVAVISLIVALSYTIWPKREPGEDGTRRGGGCSRGFEFRRTGTPRGRRSQMIPTPGS